MGTPQKVNNLVVYDLNHDVERVFGCYRVYENVTLDFDDILRVRGPICIRVFFLPGHSNQIKKMQFEGSKRKIGKHYLSSREYDMTIIFSFFINHALHIGGFNGRIVQINKMSLTISDFQKIKK